MKLIGTAIVVVAAFVALTWAAGGTTPLQGKEWFNDLKANTWEKTEPARDELKKYVPDVPSTPPPTTTAPE